MRAAQSPAAPGVAGEPAVRLHQVTKDFAETRALDSVDLTIPRGQMVAILGASGSGKPTLLRTLNGLVVPTSGAVEVLGTKVTSARGKQMRELRCGVGFIFQQFGLVGIRAGAVVLDGSPKDVDTDEVMEIYRGVVR
jgi:ABC-type methionine transport system ATPase subunit